MKIDVVVNGKKREFLIEPSEYLLDVLRRYDYSSVRRGCDNISCGVCTVLLDGKPIPSCSMLAVRCVGHEVTTVEGIEKEAEKIAHYFGELGADQCGYCNPSMALTVYALKKENREANDEEIKKYLVGNLCRCTGYVAQHEAIKKYLGDES
ncbi:MAG: 2Fe-2S iron-sulfur cluster-binding protein [Candidatus Izemoplasmatales bacterium]|nr:2Fe-2S iron-sulfur cluster-binding protein [Candidatus Izemoplasmatales bacterium]MDD4069578.1 2Fe-2S iron-sulfur cluster-binding protein [Candidatus Izemoplasmatales bacterium]MDY0139069.1 2Fe-2S iron-sulfur cluster-binding protein [Candidatus Izemoplasmatales bacterium]